MYDSLIIPENLPASQAREDIFMHFLKTHPLRRTVVRIFSLALALVLVFGCCQGALAVTPSSTSSVSATLAYTLKGLPLGRAIQNFYVGATYIYITQRVDATTYVSRLKIDGDIATYVDRMTMTNCGHGQSMDFYTHNGTEYLLMGCKSDTPADSSYNWSLQMARFKYEASKTYDYTELNRLSYMNYANKNLTRLGTTYRVAGAANSSYMIFRIQTTEGTVTYSAYDTTKLNNLLDKSESVRMDTADAQAACVFSFTQSGSSNIVRPNGSFQGIDISSKNSIYVSGGADGDVPQIAMMNSSGSYKKLVKVTNVGNLEIEGVQCKNGNVYFVIVPSTVAADKKEKHKVYYIPETKFGISHTMTTVAGKAPTCTETGLSQITKCTTCNQLLDIQEVLPKLEHTVVNVAEIPVTCTTDGMTAGTKCSACNTILSGCTTVAATGHQIVEIPAVEGDCLTEGCIAGTKCGTCGVILSGGETIPASGHKAVEVPAVEGNCLTEGCTAGTRCEICGLILSGCETIPAGGHQVEILPGKEAGCLTSGLSQGEKCTLCGEILKEQQVLPRLGHDYAYEALGESHRATCTRCSKTVTEAHSYETGICICGARDNTPTVDTAIAINHTLNLASDISVNYAVKADLLKDYDSHTLVCKIPVYEGETQTGTETVTIAPVLNGSYYYYTLTGLTAVQMGDMVEAQLHMEKEGQAYVSPTDSYSVAQYAYSQLSKASATGALKKLCADLLRYGTEAQRYKSYRTGSLADSAMTAEQTAYLSDTGTLAFGNSNETLTDLDNPVITWVGKSLSLDSKVAVKYIFSLGDYTGKAEELSLKVSYVNLSGEAAEVTLTDPQVYDSTKGWYSFTFDGLLAAELRSVVDVAVYQGQTRLSQTLRYSPDTYGNNKNGQLLELCKALFAYADTAKAYFVQ